MLVGICYQIFSCQISLKSDFLYIKLFRKYTYLYIRRYFEHRDFNLKYDYFCTCYNSYQRVFYLFVKDLFICIQNVLIIKQRAFYCINCPFIVKRSFSLLMILIQILGQDEQYHILLLLKTLHNHLRVPFWYYKIDLYNRAKPITLCSAQYNPCT